MVGTQRYWDGDAWTEHIAPASTGRPAPTPEEVEANKARFDEAAKQSRWETGLVVGLAVLFPLGGLIAGAVMLWRRRVGIGLAAIALSLVLGVVYALAWQATYGESSPSELDVDQLEVEIAKWAAPMIGERPEVDCASPMPIEVDAEYSCALFASDGSSASVTVTVEDEDGNVTWYFANN